MWVGGKTKRHKKPENVQNIEIRWIKMKQLKIFYIIFLIIIFKKLDALKSESITKKKKKKKEG